MTSMSESARKKQRLSPRISDQTSTNNSTLYADLQRLANIAPKPITPFRRAASAGITPGSRPVRTPGTGRTPRGGPATRPIPNRRAAPTTPHAIRALRERANATRTPGHVRRRSGRLQRETPRDVLRELSRVLARDQQPEAVREAPRPGRPSALDLPDIDDGPEPAAPRLSMPLGDMYDDIDSDEEAAPRQSLLPGLPEDADNGTIQSLEFGRRALSEDPRMMFATRRSERFGDLSELGLGGEEFEVDGTFISRRTNPDELLQDMVEEGDDTTTEIRAILGRQSGRRSQVGLDLYEAEGDSEEPTFRFTIPPRQPMLADGNSDAAEDLIVDAAMLDETDTIRVQDALDATRVEDEMADDGSMGELNAQAWEPEQHTENDADLQAYREEASAFDRSLRMGSPAPIVEGTRIRRQRKTTHISRFGHEYPSVPTATVKALATGCAKAQGKRAKLSKDTLATLVQTSDFFFEQIGEDLAAYSRHGGRKVIEDADVVALMKRTRQVTNTSTAFSLAQKILPRELLQQLRMEPPRKLKKHKRKRLDTIHEDEDDR